MLASPPLPSSSRLPFAPPILPLPSLLHIDQEHSFTLYRNLTLEPEIFPAATDSRYLRRGEPLAGGWALEWFWVLASQ